MTPPSVKPSLGSTALLGIAQILIWGGSFFLLAVLAEPVVRDTGWPPQWVYGALSAGLLVSGMLMPWLGKVVHRVGGRRMLCASGVLVAIGLGILAVSHHLPLFIAGWLVIGVGMAAGLYDALFATIGNLYGTQAKPAITRITLISGFCTTLTWPLLALMIAHLGWRGTCLVYAGLLLVTIAPLYLIALPKDHVGTASSSAKNVATPAIDKTLYRLMMASFMLAAIIMTAMSIQLIALLQGQGYTLAAAISLGALLGPAQVGIRVVDIVFKNIPPMVTTMMSVSFTLLGIVILLAWPAYAVAGIILYGFGNGLRAIVRGVLPLAIFPASLYATLMGRLARPSLIAQAVTPILSGLALGLLGSHATFAMLAALAGLNVVLSLLLYRYVPRPRVPASQP